MEKKLFVRQTKMPTAGDKWYTLKSYGGISPCIPGRPAAWEGSVYRNCVGHSWGRFASLEENPNCKVGCAKGNDYPGDAWTWFKNSIAQGYKTGTEPKLGAVAVWSRKNAQGHVANVEKVYDDNSWDSSESGYNATKDWWSNHYNAKSYKSGYTFIGFVYPKYEFVESLEPTPKFKVGDYVKIVAKGNSRASGTGRAAYGIGYKRYILRIIKGAKYPYQVGVGSATTGFYTESALKKL